MFNVLFSLGMIVLFVTLSFMRMLFYYLDIIIILEWMIFSLNTMNIKVFILFDWVSLLFVSFIMLISSIIMLYRIVYMRGEGQIGRFNYLLLLFILSIILIVISPHVVSILLGWDGLGMVSYCLVMYYSNYFSYNSAMVTVLCNRVGDVGILISIGLIIMVGRWDMALFRGGSMVMFILVLASITKRAQIPFSVWLPLAIAAPTPVSALVHSSTLVTAGVYLIIRFNKFLMESSIRIILFFISVVTIFMAGLIANFENDFKKIIALSTLSQLGLIIIILSLGLDILAFYHLLVHALFKSLLFMGAGSIIHLLKNNQDVRLLGNLNEVLPYTIMSLMISNMALAGVPFISGFYRKDLIIEIVYVNREVNLLMYCIIIISLMFTISYSIRLVYYLFFNRVVKFYRYIYIKESWVINLSIIITMFFRVRAGSLINWFFFFDYYFILMPVYLKLITLVYCLVGGIIGVIVVVITRGVIRFCRLCVRAGVWVLFIYFCRSIWFLVNFYGWVYNPVVSARVNFRDFDKTWFEFIIMKFVTGFALKKFSSIFYRLYSFVFILVYAVIYTFLWY